MKRCAIQGCSTILPTVQRFRPLPPDGEYFQEVFEIDLEALREHLVEAHIRLRYGTLS